MQPRLYVSIIAVLVSLLFWQLALPDAIVRTQAMLATTIAEFYVEEDGVMLNLEIGLPELEAFQNLMPDGLYEQLGNEPKPLAKRYPLFFKEDLLVIPEDGEPLIGQVLEMQPKERVKRDEITGEPLPNTDEEPETVIMARIFFPFEERPASLTFSSRMPANIGFVVYHSSVAVNDFRYLSPSQTLTLDWKDPWYSSFETRALRRTYFAPMNGYIYVEPYEVRKEVIVRPKDLQQWVDLGLEGRDTIPVEIQEELKRQVAEFLRTRQKVVIDGETVEPELARINFLERTLRTSRVIDPPEELDIDSAIMGAIFVYPTVEPLPRKVAMDWDLFNEKIPLVPAAAVDQAGSLPTYLEPDFAVLEWENFLRFPELPTLKAISPPPSLVESVMVYLRWALLAAGLWAIWLAWRRRQTAPGGPAILATGLVALSAGSFWIGHQANLSEEKSHGIVSGLLHNIYRAFDFRAEEDIYDVLEKSVEGDLLADIYLETRRSLELANQGGARAKVKDIEVVDLSTRSGENGGFIASATWNVGGSVGHWGHIHERRNRYQAELNIHPVDGVWKLTELEILQEERL